MRLSFIAAALASAIALCEGSSKMVIGYLPNWLYANYPVEQVPYSKYTHINYAFAILNNEDNLPSFTDDWAVESSLPKIVNMAHANKTKVLLSVGGWTGSKRFSPMVSNAESRKKFIDWNVDFIKKYNTDGVDLDWEYPGRQAAGCNEFADNDADNYLLLLKELRQTLDTAFPDTHKEISMAVHVQPFIKSGTPMSDVKNYVPYFDHINLMTYDINGAWATTTGPNAPFEVEAGNGAPFSFVGSIRDWKAAGVPAEKITAGLAFYGRTMKATGDMTVKRSQFQPSEVGAPKGDSDDAYWDDPYCNVEAGGLSGIWKWSNIRKEGLIKEDTITAGEGWQRNWDQVTQTPWLFNPSTKHFISYDDPQSLKVKVEHALCEDLAGVMVWDIHQDNGELIAAVNRIHDPAPATCNQETTLKNNLPDEVIEVDPETDVLSEEIDDLGVLVETPSVSVHVGETKEEPHVSDSADEFEDAEDWEDDVVEELSQSDNAVVQADELPSVSSQIIEVASPLVSAAEELPSVSPSPLTGATEVSNAPQEGQSCTTLGEQKCANSGTSGIWLTCNIDKWIIRECAPGLICKDSQGGVVCDYPNSGSNPTKATFVNKLENKDSIGASADLLLEKELSMSNELKPSASIELQMKSIIPSYSSEPTSGHYSTLPIFPSQSAIVIEDSAESLSAPEEDAKPIATNGDINILGKQQATLAVENPLANAQFI